MFRKPNKTTINKNKTTIFISQRPFDSRLYLDISKSFKWKESFIFIYFKVFQVSKIFTCGLSDLLLLAVGSLVVFVLREYILKVHILVSSEHKLCQIWNTCIVSCIYWSIDFLNTYILIMEYNCVVTVTEVLNGSFENQSRL
jgi:hypothetical protein